jgi:hypothetical protein
VRHDDEDDHPGGGGRSGGEPSWLDDVVVPDDISELDAEVRAWHRERRARARRERWRRLASPRSVTGPLMIVVLLLVAGFTSLVVLFQPRRPTAQPAPLATPGAAGTRRVLPDVLVRLPDNSTRQVRDYRPAVLALAPVGCGCDAALRDLGTAAHRFDLNFLLVDRQPPPLPAGLPAGAAIRVGEPTGRLAREYRAEQAGRRVPGGPVAVLVGSDGAVVRVLPRPTSAVGLETELALLGSSSGD